jgi:hypothetical protein
MGSVASPLFIYTLNFSDFTLSSYNYLVSYSRTVIIKYEILVVVRGYAVIVVSRHHDLSVIFMRRVSLWAT